MAWTEQQNNAINARNCSVIVSAAAGSGKTAVLTERLATMIADPLSGVRADRIIAVTFTNDAASELKKRLNMKISNLIVQNPSDKHLIKQHTLLQSARISTINAFCFELLRENITEQGITSGFSVLDEADNNIIKAQAMDELLNHYSENDYDKIAYLYDKFCMTDDEKLIEVISLIDKFLSSVAMRREWIKHTLAEFEKPFEESVYFQDCLDSALDKLKKALALADECNDMLDDIFLCNSNAQAKSRLQAATDKERIESAVHIFTNRKMPDEAEATFCSSFDNLVRIGKNDEIDTYVRELYKIKRKNLISLTREAIQVFSGAEEDFKETGDVFRILSEFLLKFDEIVWRKKCERNAISFDDGERLILEILAETDSNGDIIPSETALKIAEYYDVIMIDEYQDSNNKQDMIFKLISKKCKQTESGELIHGNNVFLVGDVKQSIYKFRLANPKNFINTLANSLPYNPNGGNAANTAIFLNKNFRSSKQVINFVNYLFSSIMSVECGDIDYTADEMLYFGAEDEYGSACSDEMLTNISFINTDSDDDADEENSSELSGENLEAALTAEKISKMICNKYPVKLKSGERPCQPSDFCILIRKNALIKEYVTELKKRGINAKGEEEKGYLKSREISVLIDVLRVIDNPLLDVPVAAIMLSPMYMFSIEELAFIKSLDMEKNLYTILNNIIDENYDECNDAFLIERCREFLKSIERFRLFAVTMTISELVDKIYDTTDFISVMQLDTDGESKRANLRALIQYAKGYEESVAFEGSGGLSGFIRYIDRVIESGNDFTKGNISASSGNYVTVQTVHKSKGLEYPFVFLAETNIKFRYDSPQVVCSDNNRIGFVLYNPELVRRYKTVSYKHICEKNKSEIISEEMRLLYVALTRAKQQLFINLKINEKRLKRVNKLLETYYLNSCNTARTAQYTLSFSDWIWISLFEHEDFKKIAENLSMIDESFIVPPVKINSKLFTFETASNRVQDELQNTEYEKQTEKIDYDLIEELKEIINFEYDSLLSKLPAKMSVTQITHKFKGQEDIFDFKLKRPRFVSENNELVGAERGTAIHTFFQYCDFELAEKNPEKEIDRIREMGYISTNQAASINVENTAAFFKNKLYSRINRADNVWREKKFMVSVSELDIQNGLMKMLNKSDGMIKGIIDLLFEENGNLILVDYKSDRGTSEEKLKERYKIQLQLYKSAIELTTGFKVTEGYLYSFELKKAIRVEL